jgi:hypothetical protein
MILAFYEANGDPIIKTTSNHMPHKDMGVILQGYKYNVTKVWLCTREKEDKTLIDNEVDVIVEPWLMWSS